MLRWLGPSAASCAVGLLAFLPASRSPAQPTSSNVLTAWAMPGHDPQRTAQATGVGPQRATAPRLVLKGLTSDPPIIGPDGTLYGFLNYTERVARVAAVRPNGQVQWTASASLPAWWTAEPPDPYPVLASNGNVSFGGGACPQPAFLAIDRAQGMGSDGCLTTVGPDGHLQGHAATRGLTKGGPRLLVQPDGALVRATIGPYSGFTGSAAADEARRNVTIYAPNGTTRRLGAGCGWANTALGSDGTLYAVTLNEPNERQSCPRYSAAQGQNSSSVVAFTPDGSRDWVTPLPLGCAAVALSVDRGHTYAAALCTSVGHYTQARVYVLDTQGHLLWTAHGAGSGYPALALDRASGDLWLADTASLQRFSSTGILRWRLTWPTTPGDKETLVLDAHGTAYVCGGDWLLYAISAGGRVVWQHQFTAPRSALGHPPGAAISPDGRLYVSSDGVTGMVVFTP